MSVLQLPDPLQSEQCVEPNTEVMTETPLQTHLHCPTPLHCLTHTTTTHTHIISTPLRLLRMKSESNDKTSPYRPGLGGGHLGARGQREKCRCWFLSSHDPAMQKRNCRCLRRETGDFQFFMHLSILRFWVNVFIHWWTYMIQSLLTGFVSYVWCFCRFVFLTRLKQFQRLWMRDGLRWRTSIRVHSIRYLTEAWLLENPASHTRLNTLSDTNSCIYLNRIFRKYIHFCINKLL